MRKIINNNIKASAEGVFEDLKYIEANPEDDTLILCWKGGHKETIRGKVDIKRLKQKIFVS